MVENDGASDVTVQHIDHIQLLSLDAAVVVISICVPLRHVATGDDDVKCVY